MKHIIRYMTIVLTAAMILSGCGSPKKTGKRVAVNTAPGVAQVLTAGIEAAEKDAGGDPLAQAQAAIDARIAEDEAQLTKESDAARNAAEDIDVDLTRLSANMVYAEVYHMVVEPEDYVGKTIRMQGTFIPFHDDENQKDYFNCLIADALACCSQGIEFIPNEASQNAREFEPGTEITVTGTFATYEEEDEEYCTLKDADVVQS
ncbi:MAG: hypothetical protein IJ899_13680 [Blautia sp.]|nr:hypothetical protein [Blautia sp.]